MNRTQISDPPMEPPPPYEDSGRVTSTTNSKGPPPGDHKAQGPPITFQNKARNGIPPNARRSMEDEYRELPKGWVRQFDATSHHQFFVDTSSHPPRSIWHHPYDDEEYLKQLPEQERQRIHSLHPTPSKHDIVAEDTDDEDEDMMGWVPPTGTSAVHAAPTDAAEREKLKKDEKFGSKLKDKFTGTTHAEREATRAQRAAQETRAYEFHQALRKGMAESMKTGKPALFGHDKDGHKLYIEPPEGHAKPDPKDGSRGGERTNEDGGAYTFNPYKEGPYSDPDARFFKPKDPYQDRGYGYPGYGYGGGYYGGLGYGGLGYGGLGYGYGGGLGYPLMGMGMMGGMGLGMGMGGMGGMGMGMGGMGGGMGGGGS